jgi:hypothetical protein
MIKTTAPYQLSGYKTLELVVESEPISSSDNYDPTSISGSSNPVMAGERTHSRAREQWPSRVSVQNVDVNMDVNVDENDEVEECHLDVEEDDIQDVTNINMDETDDAVDVQRSNHQARSSKNQQRKEKEHTHSNGYGWNGGSYQQAANSRSSSFQQSMI